MESNNQNILIICERTPRYNGGSGDQKILYTSYDQMSNIHFCVFNDKNEIETSLENVYYCKIQKDIFVSSTKWRYADLIKYFSDKQDRFIESEQYISDILRNIQEIIRKRNIRLLVFEQTGILMWSWYKYFSDNVKCVLRIHDSHYHYLLSDAKIRSRFFSKIALLGSASVQKKHEKKHITQWDQVHFLSQKEYLYYCAEYHNISKKIIYAPSSIVKEQNKYFAKKKKQTDILFVGTMSWKPNSDAVKWFLDTVLPIIKSELPDVKVKIVGKNALQKINSTDNNVDLVGFVESLDNEYKSTKLFINPSQSGGGIKVKLMEAASIGLPVVSTSDGVSGFMENINDYLIVKDKPKEYADAIIQLLENENMREEYSRKMYEYSNEYFDININQKLWKAEIGKIL